MKLLLRVLLGLILTLILLGTAGYFLISPAKRPEPVAAEETLRQIDSGKVIGYINEYDVAVWQGIPYAAAPVGELRWRAPRPPSPWEDVKPALKFGSDCAAQTGKTSPENNHFVGSEDCLYINVYAPPAADNLPVMFWIHGGANNGGSSGRSVFDGSQLAAKFNVVVVTMNYRLTNLGWLSHPALRLGAELAEDHSSNFGTLDQIAALNWTQRNVRNFGGNPQRVTIFGESAGGWNVMAMLASPMAKGLFHGAIAQSGGLDLHSVEVSESYTDEDGHPHTSREFINQLLIADGTAADRTDAKNIQNSMNLEALAAYMRGKSLEEIFTAFRSESGGKVYSNRTLIGDGIVLPAATPSQFLFANKDNYNAVPVILGTNRDETRPMLAASPKYVDRFMGFPVGIKDLDRFNALSRYGSDQWKVAAVDGLATVMRDAQSESVFAYRFDADDLRNFGFLDLKELFGAAHGLEVPYVFGNFDSTFLNIIHPISKRSERDALARSMMSYWAAFAHNGDPGTGYFGKLPQWGNWENGEHEDRLMVFDSASDGGIRMSSELLTLRDLKQRLNQETDLENQIERCQVYKLLFKERDFVQEEYDMLGGEGCTAYEIEASKPLLGAF